MRRSASSMRRITAAALVWKWVPTQRPSMRLPHESQSMTLSLKGAFVRSFGLGFMRSGSGRAGGETVPSPLSVDRHTRPRVDVAMHVAAGDAGAGIDVAADGAADHAGAGVDVPAHRAASDAFPSVHVAGNHAAMNVAGNLEILQHLSM